MESYIPCVEDSVFVEVKASSDAPGDGLDLVQLRDDLDAFGLQGASLLRYNRVTVQENGALCYDEDETVEAGEAGWVLLRFQDPAVAGIARKVLAKLAAYETTCVCLLHEAHLIHSIELVVHLAPPVRQSLVLRGAPLLTSQVAAKATPEAAPIFAELEDKYTRHKAWSGFQRTASNDSRATDSLLHFDYDTGESCGDAPYTAQELATLVARLRALGITPADYARPETARDAHGALPVDVYEIKLYSTAPPIPD